MNNRINIKYNNFKLIMHVEFPICISYIIQQYLTIYKYILIIKHMF